MAAVTGQDVAAFLGQSDDADLVALADTHAALVAAFVRAYTRGNGFDAESGEPADDIAAVITTATARLVTNPDQSARFAVGDYQVSPAVLDGWTLPELCVLNRYRRRTA